MKGISFDDYHSNRDFRLILKPKEMASPAVKVRKIDIEGADSSLDYTDFFGEAKFEDFVQKFDFSTTVPQSEFLSLYSTIKNALHGKKMRITLDDDPLFFYRGRVSVLPFTTDRGIGQVSIECDCEPWKYFHQETVAIINVNGSYDFNLRNTKKRVVPTITSTAKMTITFGGSTWTVNTGTTILPDFELVEGDNYVTVTGTGTITFKYREGSL